MLPSEKFELAVYKHVSSLEPLPANVSLPQISQIMGESDHRRAADRLIALEADNRISLTKWSGGSEWLRAQFRNDTEFFYNGSFIVQIAPQGRKYFEKLQQQAEQEEKPMSARKSPGVGNSQLLSPKRALEILKPMVHNSAYLSGEPFGSPKREEWTHTAEGALARSFTPGSRILDKFGTSQSIAFSANSTDEELRRIANDNLSAQIAVLNSAIEQLGWEVGEEEPLKVETKPMSLRDVFLVHGHDDAIKESVARFLERLDLHPVILHEQPNKGRTVIEKFEAHSDVGFAVVLLTPDDVCRTSAEEITRRARQNVILELGYFIGKLGRARVCALHREGVEIPSDIHGVLYVPYDANGGWRLKLANEIKAAGITVDLNHAS